MIHYHNCGVYSLLALLMVSSWITTGIAQSELNRNHNEFCEPRPTLVALNAPSFDTYPYYVTLQRCGGSVNRVSPRIKVCVADATQDVTVEVLKFKTKESIILKNHTSCKAQCRNSEGVCDPELERWSDNLCSCECKYEDNPPEACPARYKWNKYLCQCECDAVPQVMKCLKENKEWSNNHCGCVCPKRVVNRCIRKNKDLDEKNCQCVEKVETGAQIGIDDGNCISLVLLFAIIAVEFILLMIFFNIWLYRKDLGFLYFLRNSACISQNNEKGPPLSPNSQTHDTITYL